MDKNKVSIIVPVYNAEKHLRRCINSILAQTYRNIEVILIDDGSSDNSGIICDEYLNKDSRIRVIHKNNSGVSRSRNVGILHSTGEYMQFVDSDDYIDTHMTEELVKAMAGNIDLAICGYKSVLKTENDEIISEKICPIAGEFKMDDFLQYFGALYYNLFINSPCNKIYSASIAKENGICFDETLSMGEDLIFNLNYMNKCKAVNILSCTPYSYLEFNANSLTKKYRDNYFENEKFLHESVIEFLEKNNCYTSKNREFVKISYSDGIVRCFQNLYNSKSVDRQKRIRNISEIIYDNSVRTNIKFIKQGNLQKRIVAFCVKIKSIQGINIYFTVKEFCKKRLRLVFNLLKD